MYNMKSIKYLIDFFEMCHQTMGNSKKTVVLFKQNVENLTSIGQLGTKEVELIYSLLGMTNTDSIKWTKTLEKLSIFKGLLIDMESLDNQGRAYVLKYANVTDEIKGYLREIYNLDLVSQKNVQHANKSVIPRGSFEDALNNFISKYGYFYIVIDNLDAVCSSDVHLYTIKLSELKTKQHCLKLLQRGANFTVGEKKTDSSNPCSVRTYIDKDATLTEQLDKILKSGA